MLTAIPILLIDSLRLQLNYEYNLNVVKEISVTDSFLDLDESTRGCQDYETFNVNKILQIR